VIAALTLAMVAGPTSRLPRTSRMRRPGVVVGKFGTATVTPKELLDYVSHPS